MLKISVFVLFLNNYQIHIIEPNVFTWVVDFFDVHLYLFVFNPSHDLPTILNDKKITFPIFLNMCLWNFIFCVTKYTSICKLQETKSKTQTKYKTNLICVHVFVCVTWFVSIILGVGLIMYDIVIRGESPWVSLYNSIGI